MSPSSAKKVIIIGATSGIGKELARLYLESGCQLGITGRRCHLLEAFRQKASRQIFTACFDVRGAGNIPQLESLIGQMGGADLLIYNAGFGEPLPELDWETDRATYETNVKGFIEIVHYMFNYFVRKGHGQIAAISSIASVRGNSRAPAYSAGKAFMSIYMEGLYMKARKLCPQLSITDIQPGFMDTKTAKGDTRFWVVSAGKAARQIYRGIEKRKWRVYVSRRWWLIAQLMKWAPGWLYHGIG